MLRLLKYTKDFTVTGNAETSDSKIAQKAGEGALNGTVDELSPEHT